MIVNATKILNCTKTYKYAIPQFNINNLEWTRFILEECNKRFSPVILGVSESTIDYMGGYKLVVNIIKDLIKELNISVDVVIHLDHASSVKSCINAIDSGFTSVMIDASKYDIEKNIEMTKEVVSYASNKNVSVEAELGHVGLNTEQLNEVNVGDALRFVNETNIDFFAPAIGNIHGIYNSDVNLNYDKLKKLNDQIDIPLVLHGASGIKEKDIKKCIDYGISKVNINTDLQLAWSKSLRSYINENPNVYDPRKIIKSGEKNIKNTIKNWLEVLGGKNETNKNRR